MKNDIIVAVFSKALLITDVKKWVVDSGATRHVCANKDAFTSYTVVGDEKERLYLGDFSIANVLGKGKVLLKLTSDKTLELNDVLHVPNIRANLISVALLVKGGVTVSFESNKIEMTKDNIIIGKGYCNQGLFVLNVCNVVSPFAYLVDSINMWHARLGHVNFSYIRKMREIGMISTINNTNLNKCEICVEAKLIKRACPTVHRETELLNLIHTDLGDLKQTMTRGGKKYYITFIDDISRYAKVYLLRNKDEAFNSFLLYKAEVENQLNKKIKRIRSDRGREYLELNDYCEKEGILHEIYSSLFT